MRAVANTVRGRLDVHVFEMGEGGPAADCMWRWSRIWSRLSGRRRRASCGVPHAERGRPIANAAERLRTIRAPSSGPVDRFYFKSLYFREPNGILFEIATDGPGFATDEPMEALGERLALPPFLEGRRAEIEAGLKPL